MLLVNILNKYSLSESSMQRENFNWHDDCATAVEYPKWYEIKNATSPGEIILFEMESERDNF